MTQINADIMNHSVFGETVAIVTILADHIRPLNRRDPAYKRTKRKSYWRRIYLRTRF